MTPVTAEASEPRGHDGPACDATLGQAFGLLGKRWNGLIVGVLSSGPTGFAELRRSVGPITDSVLSDRLGELTRARLVPILDQLAQWADDNLPARLSARGT